MNKKEIKEALKEKGIKFKETDSKEKLAALLLEENNGEDASDVDDINEQDAPIEENEQPKQDPPKKEAPKGSVGINQLIPGGRPNDVGEVIVKVSDDSELSGYQKKGVLTGYNPKTKLARIKT